MLLIIILELCLFFLCCFSTAYPICFKLGEYVAWVSDKGKSFTLTKSLTLTLKQIFKKVQEKKALTFTFLEFPTAAPSFTPGHHSGWIWIFLHQMTFLMKPTHGFVLPLSQMCYPLYYITSNSNLMLACRWCIWGKSVHCGFKNLH